jgi:eukaryotic-like serine/threonine-protein kinase
VHANGPIAAGATLRDGRYRLQRLLGAGGMATVWLAEDESLARPVAVKVMADTLAADRDWVRRFEREARAAASLSHPNVVQVFDYGTEAGRPFLVMQYVAGGTLQSRDGDGARDLDVERLARDLLDAIAHIHAAGLVHRDIKPANVLLDEDGRPRITDFGIAQPRDATSLTRTGTVLGTAAYLAPEVLAGAPATPRSDLYSCGTLLAQAARADEPAAVTKLIGALTAHDPARRPLSARAALGMLDEEPGVTTRERAGARRQRERLDAGGADVATRALRTAATRALRAPRAWLPPEPRPSRPDGLRPAAGRAASGSGSRAAPRSRRHAIRMWVAAAIAVAVALIVLAVVLGSGGKGPRAPALAPPRASLQQQLDALGARVDYATRH